MAGLFGAVYYLSYGTETVRDIDAGVVAGGIQTGLIGVIYGSLSITTATLLASIFAHSFYDALFSSKFHRMKYTILTPLSIQRIHYDCRCVKVFEHWCAGV